MLYDNREIAKPSGTTIATLRPSNLKISMENACDNTWQNSAATP